VQASCTTIPVCRAIEVDNDKPWENIYHSARNMMPTYLNFSSSHRPCHSPTSNLTTSHLPSLTSSSTSKLSERKNVRKLSDSYYQYQCHPRIRPSKWRHGSAQDRYFSTRTTCQITSVVQPPLNHFLTFILSRTGSYSGSALANGVSEPQATATMSPTSPSPCSDHHAPKLPQANKRLTGLLRKASQPPPKTTIAHHL
jgi:hypothetical protein